MHRIGDASVVVEVDHRHAHRRHVLVNMRLRHAVRHPVDRTRAVERSVGVHRKGCAVEGDVAVRVHVTAVAVGVGIDASHTVQLERAVREDGALEDAPDVSLIGGHHAHSGSLV